MMNRINQPFAGKSLWFPFWVIGLAGLLIVALWWSGTSTALAQDGGEGEPEHTEDSTGRESDDNDGRAGGGLGLDLSNPQTLQCIIDSLVTRPV